MKRVAISIKVFLVLTIITGIVYPLIITLFAQLSFPENANGSMVYVNGRQIGSKLLGQNFDTIHYFVSRPSATNYNTMPSGGSNLGPTSSVLKDLVLEREQNFRIQNNLKNNEIIPEDMLMSSASGLDPHISPTSAKIQVQRIAKIRNFTPEQTNKLLLLINSLTEQPQYHLFGCPRINVLLLNLELDKI